MQISTLNVTPTPGDCGRFRLSVSSRRDRAASWPMAALGHISRAQGPGCGRGGFHAVLCRPDRPQSLWSIQGDYSRREVDSPFSENETMRKSLESLSRKGQVRKRGGGLISLFQMCVGLLDGGETSHVGAAPDSKEGVNDNRV